MKFFQTKRKKQLMINMEKRDYPIRINNRKRDKKDEMLFIS